MHSSSGAPSFAVGAAIALGLALGAGCARDRETELPERPPPQQLQQPPQQPVHLALLLKTIPCLEQLDKQVGIRLLEGIQAEHILVSFPAHSLGGQSRGMVQNYEAHFREMVAGRHWSVQRFLFPGELAFLVSR